MDNYVDKTSDKHIRHKHKFWNRRKAMFMFGNKFLFLSMLLAAIATLTMPSQARAQDAFTDFILEQEERLKEVKSYNGIK